MKTLRFSPIFLAVVLFSMINAGCKKDKNDTNPIDNSTLRRALSVWQGKGLAVRHYSADYPADVTLFMIPVTIVIGLLWACR